MRLCIYLKPSSGILNLPINYQSILSGIIYNLFSISSDTYAAWLHDEGHTSSSKKFKLFTFSKLLSTDRPEIKSGQIWFRNSIRLLVSIPNEDAYQFFYSAINKTKTIFIDHGEQELFITEIENIPTPDFSSTMFFTCLSPIFVKKSTIRNGSIKTDHLLPNHPEFSRIITDNLKLKYAALTGLLPMSQWRIDFKANEKYIAQRGGIDRISKLITIHEGKSTETKNKAFECPFVLHGSTELMETAYKCGIGVQNSMGFGMIEVDKKNMEEHE